MYHCLIRRRHYIYGSYILKFITYANLLGREFHGVPHCVGSNFWDENFVVEHLGSLLQDCVL